MVVFLSGSLVFVYHYVSMMHVNMTRTSGSAFLAVYITTHFTYVSVIIKRRMDAFSLCWSLAGLALVGIFTNGVTGFDEMDLFNGFNDTSVYEKQENGANVLMVGLTLVQAASAKGAGNNLLPFHFS